MRGSAVRLASAALALSLGGCDATLRGAPPRSLQPQRDVLAAVIDASLDPAVIQRAIGPSGDVAARDAIIFARLAELDRLYYDYERALSREARDSNLVVSLAALAAGIGGTLASNGLSQAFSAGSTAIAGANEAFNEDVLLERTVASLTSQMRANRAAIKIDILSALEAPTRRYPLVSALADTERYWRAGTLVGALTGIAEITAVAETAGRRALDAAEQKFITSTVVVEAVRQEAANAAPDRTARARAIVAAIQALSDEGALALVAEPPTTSDTFAAALEPFPTAATSPLIARLALEVGFQALPTDEATLAAWERALAP